MAITSGFFNSVNNDRTYNSADISRMFDGLITSGVIGGVGNRFQVTATGTNRILTVGVGRAWFLSTWIYNDSNYQITVAAGSSLPRRDVVVLDFNSGSSVRNNTISIVQGTPATTPSRPVLANTTTRRQVPIAEINVPANANAISQAHVTYMVGTNDCPLATAILGGLDADANILQWDALIRGWYNSVYNLVNSSSLTALTQEVVNLGHRVQARKRNMIVNSGMQSLTTDNAGNSSHSGVTTLNGYPNAGPTMWRFSTSFSGTWTISRSQSDNRYYFLANMTAAQGIVSTGSYTYISQRIDIPRALETHKGTPNAKPVTLSFVFRSNRAGTYNVELIDPAANQHVTRRFIYSSAQVNTPVEYVIEFPPNITPAAATGYGYTPHTHNAYELRFWLRAGTTFTSGSEQLAWSTPVDNRRASGNNDNNTISSNYLIGQVQLEPGKKSQFELVDDTEFYYERNQKYFYGMGHHTAGTVHVIVPYHKKLPYSGNFTVISASFVHSTGNQALALSSNNSNGPYERLLSFTGNATLLGVYSARMVNVHYIADWRL